MFEFQYNLEDLWKCHRETHLQIGKNICFYRQIYSDMFQNKYLPVAKNLSVITSRKLASIVLQKCVSHRSMEGLTFSKRLSYIPGETLRKLMKDDLSSSRSSLINVSKAPSSSRLNNHERDHMFLRYLWRLFSRKHHTATSIRSNLLLLRLREAERKQTAGILHESSSRQTVCYRQQTDCFFF